MGLLARLFGEGHRPRDLVADLTDTYRAESAHAALLRAHATRARYPQVAEALGRLAGIEERHAAWLRDRLVARGAEVPAIESPTPAGRNQWERACEALRLAQQKRKQMVDHIVHWDPEEPDPVELWRRIEQEDARELPVYEALVMRSDPQSLD